MNSVKSTHLPTASLSERVSLMSIATAPGARSLAGSTHSRAYRSLNQKSPVKDFPHQNASQRGVFREEVSTQVACTAFCDTANVSSQIAHNPVNVLL